MIKRFFEGSAAFFVLVYAWKIALLCFSAQPIPSNDAFFYDGPVVNYLLHGKYCNPSLALALPISGSEVFSAYPPLYQVVLLAWMWVFGTSAIAAMAFHMVLFGIYLLLILAVFRELQLPVKAHQIAAAFLFVITFHDRPDTLAHVFGIAAIYTWVRSRASIAPQGRVRKNWIWATMLLMILSLATGLQIGCVYFGLIWIGILATAIFAKEPIPILPLAVSILVPIGLLALVIFGFPRLWQGFMEHAKQTPSLTGWRWPRLAEWLKVFRTVPGILFVAALLPWLWKRRPNNQPELALWIVTITMTSAALAIIVASLFVLTPNSVGFAAYLQPLIIGVAFALLRSLFQPRLIRWILVSLVALAILGAIRAIGMSTWGLACAGDLNYSRSLQRLREVLPASSDGKPVILSAAYLYEAARHPHIRSIHSDWLAPASRTDPVPDSIALIALKPEALVLTQFDYYRRYEAALAELAARPDLVAIETTNTARVRAPDSSRRFQRVVQHVSWAPVIVNLSWK